MKDRAILLSKIKYSEADLILKFISVSGDVYSCIARSALKSKKRFGGGVLEPTHFMSITLAHRGESDTERLMVLEEAQVIDDFSGLKKDYDRLILGLQFVKVVAIVAREGDSNIDIFNLLGHALKAAETSSDLSFLKMQFNLKFLHLQGVLPPEPQYSPFLRTSIRLSSDVASDVVAKTADTPWTDNFKGIQDEIESIFAAYVGRTM